MNRVIHSCAQGSNEWLQLRANFFTASELSAASGDSKYQSRADIIKQKATGISRDIDQSTQRLFDAGHAAESAARPIVEGIIADELYPVTMSCEVDGIPLLASLDGINMSGDVIWESKLLNASLKADIERGVLGPHYALQIEQQLLVSGAEKCFFTTSDGTPEGTFGMWYQSDPALRAKIVPIWRQFSDDVAAYHYVESATKPVTGPVETLPSIFVSVEGRVTDTNLPAFVLAAHEYIGRINTELVTDADFDTAAKNVTELKSGEDRLETVKENALAQTATISDLFRAIDQIKEEMRSKRLHLTKLVAAEKESRKGEIISKAREEYGAHWRALCNRIGGEWIPATPIHLFADAIKGLKSLDSMRDKVSVALANAKIESSAIADRIESNLKQYADIAAGYEHLFPDIGALSSKPADDFEAVVLTRINQHAEQEKKRLDVERARIRQEEAAKLQAEHDQRGKAAEATHAEPSATVMPQVPAVSTPPASPRLVDNVAAIKLGEINARLGFTVTSDFLASLNFRPARTEGNAKLYLEVDFQAMCSAICRHVSGVASKKLNAPEFAARIAA